MTGKIINESTVIVLEKGHNTIQEAGCKMMIGSSIYGVAINGGSLGF